MLFALLCVLLILCLVGAVAFSPLLFIVVIAIGLFIIFGGRSYRE